MDKFESLTNQLSQITMYDIKTMYNQAKNVVLNVSEIEAKVQEATNEDPWGASSTLMQDIANRTFNYPDFNEIMPAIYSRFMEKEAKQWRQIYKALQLLEYLVKHGSERVVDDARAHVSTIKMLRNFHYIDDKGKDEGINVRNRSKEIVEMLSDVEKIRSERRKAKANKHKYTGTGNDGLSFSSGGGGSGRYGGYGNDASTYVGGSSSNYGNADYNYGGSGGGSASSSSFRDDGVRRGYEEYTGADDDSVATTPPVRSNSSSLPPRSTPQRKATAPPPAPEIDLLGGLDDFTAPVAASPLTNKALPVVSNASVLDDDDFDEFQVAPPSPAPVGNQALLAMLSSNAAPSQQSGLSMGMAQPVRMGSMHGSTPSMSSTPFYTGSAAAPPQQRMGSMAQPVRSTPSMSSTPSYTGGSMFSSAPMQATSPPPLSTKPASSANFDDLWSMSLGATTSKPATPVAGKSIKDLEKEKAQASIWGGAGGKPASSSAFGAFGTGTTTGDDLLL